MRANPRFFAIVVLIAALAIPTSASAATKLSVSAKASPTSIAANGGTVSLKVTFGGATTCTFSSTPVGLASLELSSAPRFGI